MKASRKELTRRRHFRIRIGDRLFDLFIATAHAAEAPSATASDPRFAPQVAFDDAVRKLPGAFKLPADTRALIDHRYLWDAQGNLLLTQSKPASATASAGSLTAPEPQAASGHALHTYDERDRLIVSVRKQPGDQSAVQIGRAHV